MLGECCTKTNSSGTRHGSKTPFTPEDGWLKRSPLKDPVTVSAELVRVSRDLTPSLQSTCALRFIYSTYWAPVCAKVIATGSPNSMTELVAEMEAQSKVFKDLQESDPMAEYVRVQLAGSNSSVFVCMTLPAPDSQLHSSDTRGGFRSSFDLNKGFVSMYWQHAPQAPVACCHFDRGVPWNIALHATALHCTARRVLTIIRYAARMFVSLHMALQRHQ